MTSQLGQTPGAQEHAQEALQARQPIEERQQAQGALWRDCDEELAAPDAGGVYLLALFLNGTHTPYKHARMVEWRHNERGPKRAGNTLDPLSQRWYEQHGPTDIVPPPLLLTSASKPTEAPMSDGTVFIYALCEPDTGEVRYVGKTQDPYHRFYEHVAPNQDNRKSNTHKYRWIQQLRQQGVQPLMRIIEEVSEQEWQERERYWIAYYHATGAHLTNIKPGGEGGLTPESAAKMSASRRGHSVSPATREKISQKLRGRKLAPDHAVKVTAAVLSAKRTRMWADRISATRRKQGEQKRGDTFRCGHPRTPENTYTYRCVDSRSPINRERLNQQCRECRREKARIRWQTKHK